MPAEIRAMTYEYIFPCWYEEFHAAANLDGEDLQHPYTMLQYLVFGWRRNKSPGKYVNGAAALLMVFKLLHNEAAEILYGQYTFTTAPAFCLDSVCCSENNRDYFNPDIGLLHDFLTHIGLNNRRRLRHLFMGLHAFLHFPVSATQLTLSVEYPNGPDFSPCSQRCNKDFWWQLSRTLALLQEIAMLDTLMLPFADGVDYTDPDYGWDTIEPEDEGDYKGLPPNGMVDANYYLDLFSNLENVGHVETIGCLGMADSELFARLVGAKTIAVHRNHRKSSMIHFRQALDYGIKDTASIEARENSWGWKQDRNGKSGCFTKMLTPDNMTPAVAKRLWAIRDMEGDLALITELANELDLGHRC